MSLDGDVAVCRSCGQTVASDDYDVFEQMHFVCFHYEFEHHGDVDKECTSIVCPSRPVPRGFAADATPAAGQFARIGVVIIEAANGTCVVRLPNGDDVVVQSSALAPDAGRADFAIDPAGEQVSCRDCDWSLIASDRLSAEALFRHHFKSEHNQSS